MMMMNVKVMVMVMMVMMVMMMMLMMMKIIMNTAVLVIFTMIMMAMATMARLATSRLQSGSRPKICRHSARKTVSSPAAGRWYSQILLDYDNGWFSSGSLDIGL